MLPFSDTSKPDDAEDTKHYSYFSSLKHYLSLHTRCLCVLASLLLLHLLLLLLFSPFSAFTSTATTGISGIFKHNCTYGKIYVYNLPPQLNADILRNCTHISPFRSRCDDVANAGFGKSAADGLSKLMPNNLSSAWFWTNQYSLEPIFHNRMLNYPCRTLEPESAAAYYIPSYLALAVEYYMFTPSSDEDRDRHCVMMLDWVNDQPYFKKSNGSDHLVAMGRMTGDFRRPPNGGWGTYCLNRPIARNITRFIIEKDTTDYSDIGVPYPTGFHPRSVADVRLWQDFVGSHQRRTLFCFSGGRRIAFKDDFREVLMNRCKSEPGSCRVVECVGSTCEGGSPEVLENFLGSKFCLQPRGDTMTRRSVFDCMVAGSIPVFFWRETVRLQYDLILPHEPETYSVFIDRMGVRNGTISIKSVLDQISEEKVENMRRKVIELIPKLVYASSELEGMKDAFDVAVEGALRRIKEQGGHK